jgi:putative ABC transport system permease protein
MWGVGTDYLLVRNAGLRAGSFFTEHDVASAAKVCVIGHTVVKELFQTSNPIGARIRVKNIPFRVIGVLEPKGTNLVGQDQDNVLLMPYTTVMKRLQGSALENIHLIFVSARSQTEMYEAEAQVRNLMKDRHRIRADEPEDFEINNTTDIANVLGVVTGTLTMMLASIAAISLVVGGVGIMNIMLVSVTERTREIGIRMAVGARPRDILWQFLVESVVLSSLGGIVGIALGVGGSAALTYGINMISSGADWPTVISLPAAAVAMLFSAMVGIFFGFYPARRASRLDPIEALRYE